jgi:SAM-dependent methyltransferase
MKKKIAKAILKLVEDSYNSIATDFDLTRKKELWPKIKEYAAKVDDGNRVLDLACGNGRLLQAFKDKKISYLGIDNSIGLVNIARRNYPGFEFVKGNVLYLLDLLDKEKKYDYVFCLAALQHIPGKKLRLEALKNMGDILAENGEVIVSNWNLWQSQHRKKIFLFIFYKIIGFNSLDFKDILFPWKRNNGQRISYRYYHAFTKRELIKLAEKAGFKKIILEKDKYNYWLFLKK